MISLKIIYIGIMLVAFLTTFFLMKPFMKRSKEKGFVVKDMYKKDKPKIPTMGGLVILTGILISLIFAIFFDKIRTALFIFYFTVFMFGLYGLTDDLFGFKKRRNKVWVLFLLALPIALLTTDTDLSILFFEVELGLLYPFVFAPLYIMVVANLINIHAGYNGLSGGVTLIMLIFSAIKSYLINNLYYVYLIVPLIGALAAFMYFNKYPSRIFLGNVGTFLIGAGLGGYLVLSNIEIFGIIILIPHIINFLMWIYWCKIMYREPHVKFGKIRDDGTIEPPNGLTVKYLVTKLFKVNEPKAVYICYGITIVFGVIGLILR